MRSLLLSVAIAVVPPACLADTFSIQIVAEGIWAIEGPAEQRSPENLGNNATFGLIETDDGAVLVDPGGTRAGAEMLQAVVADLTDHPVTHVINTGGQDHRWLGNGYWRERGAEIIASEAAVTDQRARASLQLTMLSELVGAAGLSGTDPAFAETTFAESFDLSTGGRRIEIHHVAPAHTPGDSFVWLPDEGIVFTGDIVFVGRLLGVLEVSDTAGWLDAFSAIEALTPAQVVPGHGPVTDLATAQADTRDYLANLRARMRDYIDAGGDIIGSVDIDQSAFAYLDQFEALSRRNAQAAFAQMEWE